MPDHVDRDAKRFGGFFSCESAEVSHLDHPGERGVFTREFVDSGVQVNELDQLEPLFAGCFQICGPGCLIAGGTFQCRAASRVINEDLAHHSRSYCEEVCLIREPALSAFKKL